MDGALLQTELVCLWCSILLVDLFKLMTFGLRQLHRLHLAVIGNLWGKL